MTLFVNNIICSVLSLNIGVGNITYASTDAVEDLVVFYQKLEGLDARGGGDFPEYSLDAMLKALNFIYEDSSGTPFPVMDKGSQIIVITDATSKNKEKEKDVIDTAIEFGVCIHFFVSEKGTEDGIYQRIADETSGTLISPFSNWDVANKFKNLYEESPCEHITRKKRAAIATRSTSPCQSFQISPLSILFQFLGNTDLNVSLTRPSGTTIEILGSAGVALHSERYPEPGEWLACLIMSSGDLEFSVDQHYSLDATLGYLKKTNTGTIVASISPPTECK